MYKPALLAAALSATVVYGDFIVITETNIPTVPTPSFANEADAKSYASLISEVNDNVMSMQLTNPAFQEVVSAFWGGGVDKKLSEFFSTATYDIPKEVLATDATVTFTTVPPWYTALPSDVKDAYDKAASLGVEVAKEVAAMVTGAPSGSLSVPGLPSGLSTILPSGQPSASRNGTLKTETGPSPTPTPTPTTTGHGSFAAPTNAVGIGAGLLAGGMAVLAFL